jgi:hypothetical protein
MGARHDKEKLKALPPGSFYTEPPGEDHRGNPRQRCSGADFGLGPTGTTYVEQQNDPRQSKH